MSTSSPALPFAKKMTELYDMEKPFFRVFEFERYKNRDKVNCCDFAFGNPHDMPLPGYVAAVQKYSVPQNELWYAYSSGNEHARDVVAKALTTRTNRPYHPEDIIMTNGAFGALSVTLQALVESGDEVIYILPPWFFYAGMIHHAGGKPVPVNIRTDNYDLDLDAISAAITPQTKAIILNSPHNPTGKIFQPPTLEALGQLLMNAKEKYGRPIYLISDEAYNRILFDNNIFYSPTDYYPYSIRIYTYGKTLLNPGERLGYLALSPEMIGRETLRKPLQMAHAFTGFATPNSLQMHAIAELETLCIDLDQLQKRRDRLVSALDEMGYDDIIRPEGTFYVMVKSPLSDDIKFFDTLADYDIFVLPGAVVDMPGYFRISLTANDDMIERSLAGFASALQVAKQQPNQT